MSSKRRTDTEVSPSPMKRVTRSNRDSNVLTVVDHHEIPENLKLWAWDVKSTEKKTRIRYDENIDTVNSKRSKTPSKKEQAKTPKKDIKQTISTTTTSNSKDITTKTPSTSNKKINLRSTATPKSAIKETNNSNQSAVKVANSGRKKAASDSAQTLSNVENVINTSDAKNDDSEATTVVIKEGSVKNNGWSIMDYLMIIIFYVIINYALSIRSKNISLAKM